MAVRLTGEVLDRALKADTLVALVTKQIKNLRDLQERECMAKWQEENVALRAKILEVKAALVQAEIANGKAQIALPDDKKEVSKKSATVTATPVAPAEIKPPVAVVPKLPVVVVAPAASTKNEATDKKETEKKDPAASDKKKGAKPAPVVETPKPLDISRIDLRVGLITKAVPHPDADKLYLETVETGEEKPRTVISGLAGKVPLEQMQNRLVVLMMNLKPAKMRNIVSEAMVMCANTEAGVEVLDPPAGAVPGDRVVVPGYLGVPDVQLKEKEKVLELCLPDLKTDEHCVATYKGIPWVIEGKGQIKAQTMKNAGIK